MKSPKVWNDQEIRADAAVGIAAFIASRTTEPVQNYLDEIEKWNRSVGFAVRSLDNFLTNRMHQDAINILFASKHNITALRYTAAPPISEDDLKTVADTTLSPSKLKKDASERDRVRQTLARSADPIRFPWIGRNSPATDEEISQATTSTIILLASQRVQTERRSSGMKEQEKAAKEALEVAGYTEGAAPRTIRSKADWPAIGTYTGEKTVAGTRADIICRMKDDRLLLIECKASNSAVNSFKRLNHEAEGKAKKWNAAYPGGQVVSAAVISGVFGPEAVASAQRGGVAIFWSHRLQDLTDFVS